MREPSSKFDAHAGTGNIYTSVVVYKSFHSGDIMKKTNLTNEKNLFYLVPESHP